jgi:hypothetical protein
MQTALIAIVVLSVLFQFVAALFALRLIPITGKKTAWLLVAVAISLMTVRRFQSLVLLVSGQSSAAPELFFEVVGLIISFFMMAGIYLIQPLFRAMAFSQDELRGMNEKLSSLSAEQTTLIINLQDALAKIKTLRGMLPICASCKTRAIGTRSRSMSATTPTLSSPTACVRTARRNILRNILMIVHY